MLFCKVIDRRTFSRFYGFATTVIVLGLGTTIATVSDHCFPSTLHNLTKGRWLLCRLFARLSRFCGTPPVVDRGGLQQLIVALT